MEIKLLSAADF